MAATPFRFAVDADHAVSGLLDRPEGARACLVLAHGAGAGMAHPFMAAIATGLATGGIAVLRYQFPYMEAGSGRPDAPALAHATVRAAVAEAAKRVPGLPLFAGGKSFGGRMTSQAEALAHLADVRGLVFLGFPLHPAGKPSVERAAHLAGVRLPMLFLQGTGDTLAELDLLTPVVDGLDRRARLVVVADGDHSFHVRKASGRDDRAVIGELVEAIAGWIDTLA